MIFNPLSTALLAILALLALWLLTRRGFFLVTLVIVVGLTWLLSTPAMSRGLQSLLERQISDVPAESLPKVDAIVVLGGTLTPPPGDGGEANLSAAADRLVYAARLYKLGKAPVILVSGGYGGEDDSMRAESVHAATLLESWGIPKSAILTETESTNTYENATFTKLMLEQHGLDRVLLVTSAMHMPRALATFRSAGIRVRPAPTDFESTYRHVTGIARWTADPGSLAITTRALKEFAGWFVYRQRGWIEDDESS